MTQKEDETTETDGENQTVPQGAAPGWRGICPTWLFGKHVRLRTDVARRALTGVTDIWFAGWIEPQNSFIWPADSL